MKKQACSAELKKKCAHFEFYNHDKTCNASKYFAIFTPVSIQTHSLILRNINGNLCNRLKIQQLLAVTFFIENLSQYSGCAKSLLFQVKVMICKIKTYKFVVQARYHFKFSLKFIKNISKKKKINRVNK